MIVSFRHNQLYYQVMGKGPRWVLAFHGYGETGDCFRSLAAELADEFSFICPDLPLHGKSSWNADSPMNPDELGAIVRELMQIHQISSFVLAGYSMGGRLAACLLTREQLPVDELWLFAPDGFHRNPWYWMATQTNWGNRLFRFTMEHPKLFLKAMHAAQTLRLLHPGIYKFSIQFLLQEKARKDLYQRWTFYKNFRVQQPALKQQLIHFQIPVRMFFGKNDRIIPPAHGQWMQQNNPALTQTRLLKTGHRLLDPAITPNIAATIRTPVTESIN